MMKKLLVVYILLIGIFMVYAYNFHFKDEVTSVWDNKGLQGEITDTYVIVTFQSGIDYWKSVLKGFEDAAQALNVSVEYRGATQYDVQEQITVLEQVIAKKPAGIALTAIDPYQLTDTINKAIDAGIPIVLFDSGAEDSRAYSFLGTNNYNAGITAAHEMARLLDENGEVAVVTQPNQLNHQQRTEGFQDTIAKEYPQMKVVAVEDGKGDRLVSREAALFILEKHPNISGIFASEANGGVGVGEAVRLQRKMEDVKIISFDTDKGTLDMVENGTISATLAQGTWHMGYWSLHFLFHLHQEQKQSQVLHTGLSDENPLPIYVDTGITIVTKDNVKDFYAN